jgi:sigma-B regulation protein RsbU (phosphoserine phosphatase)
LSKALSSVVDVDDLLTVIVEKASAVVEAERTSVFIYDATREKLWSRVAQGVGDRIEMSVGAGIVGDVAKSRTMLNVSDAYADPRFSRDTDVRTGFRTRGILCAPILDSKGALLGVLQSINKATGDHFDAHDESLMNALAAHVAVAIERAQTTEVEQALRVANDIQMKMLPSGDVVLPDAAPFALKAHMTPARHVGGDLYDFFWTDERLYFCIGDVTGKGIGAALVMAVTKTLFRAHATFQDDPAKLMSAVNARLYEETDPAMFVTAFCGFLDLRTGHLRFSNAGHDRPLLLSAGRPAYRLESKSGLPLGVLANFNYTVEDLSLGAGDALLLYTDGVTEATNRNEQLFSIERVCEVLNAHSSESPSNIVDAILAAVGAFSEGTPQADDITMVCVQYRGSVASFKRDLAELERVFAFVGGIVKDSSVDFAVEEIFVNCVTHNADGKGDIEVRVARDGNDVSISIADPDAQAYDIDVEVDTHATLNQRVPGGLGLYLTRQMMDRVEYVHENGTGTVTIHKRVG